MRSWLWYNQSTLLRCRYGSPAAVVPEVGWGIAYVQYQSDAYVLCVAWYLTSDLPSDVCCLNHLVRWSDFSKIGKPVAVKRIPDLFVNPHRMLQLAQIQILAQ